VAADEDQYIYKEPGRLVYAASGQTISISGTPAFPHGGTSLGYTESGIELEDRPGSLMPLSAEDRRRPFEYLMIGDTELSMHTDLLQWDNDALALAFPTVFSSAGATSGLRIVSIPSTFEDGALASTIVCQVLFVPDNTREGTYVYFPAAVPWPDESRRRMLKRSTIKSVPLVFRALEGTLTGGTKAHLLHGNLRDITAFI